jgi:pectinesterase
MEAIERAPDNRKTPFIIQLKAGVYKEYVLIPSEKSNVRLVGEGRSSTIITGNRYHTLEISTFKSATMSKSF